MEKQKRGIFLQSVGGVEGIQIHDVSVDDLRPGHSGGNDLPVAFRYIDSGAFVKSGCVIDASKSAHERQPDVHGAKTHIAVAI